MKPDYIVEPEHEGLEKLRGMSEPLAFAFNMRKPAMIAPMLVHAVIFTSYEVGDNDRKIHLCSPEDDPRMGPFIDFCITNYGKKAKEVLIEEIKARTKELDDLNRAIADARKQLKTTERARHHDNQ